MQDVWNPVTMTRTIRYLSHPQVVIDPEKEIHLWSLNDVGLARVHVLAASGALTGTRHVISSMETKAQETAAPLAKALGLNVTLREKMHENDRSATGFLPPDTFEAVADQFFAHPDHSVRGWETARTAQARIVAEVETCLRLYPQGDVLFVGHGAVGTLLYCHLCDLPISRAYDQGPGGGGCYFEFLDPEGAPVVGWQAMETLLA